VAEEKAPRGVTLIRGEEIVTYSPGSEGRLKTKEEERRPESSPSRALGTENLASGRRGVGKTPQEEERLVLF